MTPRGQRTGRLLDALREEWDVELIAMAAKPSVARPDGSSPLHTPLRRIAVRALQRVLLDRHELWSAKRLGRWRPDADAALLVASPWSPVSYASRRLAGAGVPYVVDVGDPWVLTATYKPSVPIGRACRAEHFLWENAAGAVVTTRAQYEPLHAMFPDLPIMIRPNGYSPVKQTASAPDRTEDSTLRIAHFGILSPARIDPVPFIEVLRRSGRWSSIVFSQFGDDFGAGLDRLAGNGVRVEHNRAIPWEEVLERAQDFDAALVVAYPITSLLPSKAIEYSTLPLPRIALTNADPGDATREYVRNRAGWLAVSSGEPDVADRVAEHLLRRWSLADLAPAAEDAWPVVAAEIADFVTACLKEGIRNSGQAHAGALR